MSNLITVPGRDIGTVTAEIRLIVRDTQQMLLAAAVKIGQRLVEAKEMVPYGEWGRYLKDEVEFSQSTANNFMRLYEEYGSKEYSLFSGPDSQALGNLTYTKALRLLALPAEVRESFAEENNVGAMSTRELEKAIRERDAEKAKRLEAEEAANSSAEVLCSLREEADRAGRARDKAIEEMEQMERELEGARLLEQETAEKLRQALESPAVPETVLLSMRREVEAEEAAKHAKELETKLAGIRAEAEKKLQEAKKKAAEALAAEKKAHEKAAEETREASDQVVAVFRERAETAEQSLSKAQEQLAAMTRTTQLSDPNAAVFKTLFEQVQQDFNRLNGVLLKVQTSDPALAEKFRGAMKALLDKLREDV